ncbi:hypothetical protein TeGR_g13885, partial [Tetraparma gracilis]
PPPPSYLRDCKEEIDVLAREWRHLKTRMHARHNHNMQCKIDLKWNARASLASSPFAAHADVMDYALAPRSRKFAMHTPPILDFDAAAVKQGLAEEEQRQEEERQKEREGKARRREVEEGE